MYLTWIYSQFLSTPQDHYNIITGSQLFEHYKKILQRGWKALRIASYLPFILFPAFKRRKSSLRVEGNLPAEESEPLNFLLDTVNALGNLDLADTLSVGDSILGTGLCAPSACVEGGKIQVSSGALRWRAPAQLAWAGTTRVVFL